MEKSADRAAEIAHDLATFSRPDKELRAPAQGNLNAVVQRSAEVMRSSIAKQITWTVQLERRLFATRFDEAKMQQAIIKILENAGEAIESSGRITVQTRNFELSEATQDRDLRLAPGTYVCVEVSDTGAGIPSDVLPRIFEPFFTTRKAAGHRGLGLALVYGIVTNHGGGVAVSSQPGSGTSVRMYLPAEKRVVKDDTGRAGDLKGKETILLIDNEELLLTMGRTVLTGFGYTVHTANGGQKALDLLQGADFKVDLAVVDMVMPGMSGRELMEHLRQVSPELPVICISGYLRPPDHDDQIGFLQKPFTSQELVSKVRATLDGEH
jgi:two-component system cell cycle sensor histidine kinase/response regulator CckA